MKELRCSVCEKFFLPSDPGVVLPFCSIRCKRIDALRWLDEVYGLPLEEESEDENIERSKASQPVDEDD